MTSFEETLARARLHLIKHTLCYAIKLLVRKYYEIELKEERDQQPGMSRFTRFTRSQHSLNSEPSHDISRLITLQQEAEHVE